MPPIDPIALETHQEPSVASPTLTDLSPTRGQKRGYVSEDECPRKQLRRDRQSVSESSQPLTKANLEKFDRLAGSGTSDGMDPAASERGARKRRSLSRQSSTGDMNQETASVQSQRSSYTASHYRWVTLSNARIFIRPGSLPEEIRPRINAVIQRRISKERKCELSRIAENLYNDFINVLNGASSEDDCIEPIHRALSSMDGSSRKFNFPRKADWDPSLKPSIPQGKPWDFTFLNKSNDKVGDSVTRPRMQQQGDTLYVSPESSQLAMPPPPPPLPPKQDTPLVKTPRPDITAGLCHSTIVDALVARDLNQTEADDLLRTLQQQQILCSDPAQQALPIRFPPMVIEGKSYATGKSVFEAQNQAAVSGSCMTNLQHKLADLTERASPGSYQRKAPLAFSICTEGPHMELWAHYTTSQDGVRMYNMNILKTCYASLQEGVVEFLMMVDSVMSWAKTDFLDEIAEQLVLVERAGRVQHAT